MILITVNNKKCYIPTVLWYVSLVDITLLNVLLYPVFNIVHYSSLFQYYLSTSISKNVEVYRYTDIEISTISVGADIAAKNQYDIPIYN